MTVDPRQVTNYDQWTRLSLKSLGSSPAQTFHLESTRRKPVQLITTKAVLSGTVIFREQETQNLLFHKLSSINLGLAMGKNNPLMTGLANKYIQVDKKNQVVLHSPWVQTLVEGTIDAPFAKLNQLILLNENVA